MIGKNLNKKKVAVVITGLLAIAMAATVVAAPGGFGRGAGQQMGTEFSQGQRPEMPEGQGRQMTEGQRPELPEGEDQKAMEGQRPERPDEMMGPGRGMNCIDTEKIKTEIDAVEDEEVKSKLQSLLSDYENAKTALESALDDAGIDTRPQLPDKTDKTE